MTSRFFSNPVLQIIPGAAVIVLGVAAAGVLPWGVHRLYHGEGRKVNRDRWDFEMERRDDRLRREAKALAAAPAPAPAAAAAGGH